MAPLFYVSVKFCFKRSCLTGRDQHWINHADFMENNF